MARFFFDLHDGRKTYIDKEGSELTDVDAACDEARHYLPDIARDEIPRAGDRRGFMVLVRDERGKPVYSATLTYEGVRHQG